MSYLVLARKWRPKSFEQLVGQEHVVKALSHALNHNRLHHGYLFTGTRGVGKTTLSRILAKSLSCVECISAQPCGVCDACVGIDSGRFPDYIEMDAASNRGVDEMAQILEQSVYSPVSGRFKIFMIDEVHMLTNHAFNAMLKTLEEPPEHVKFILATTDPQKIPVTVLSRCLQFSLKNMSPQQVSSHLSHILQQESVVFDAPSLRMISLAARGSMRDALSLTDQAIAHGAGSLEESSVRSMLGMLDQTYIYRLLNALSEQRGAQIVEIVNEMSQRSLSFSQAMSDIAVCLQQIALLQTVPDLPTDSWEAVHQIKQLAQQLAPEFVQLCYTIALHSRSDLGLAPDEASGVTMAMIRMLAFKPGDKPAVVQTNHLSTRSNGGNNTQNKPSYPPAADKFNEPAPGVANLAKAPISESIPVQNEPAHHEAHINPVNTLTTQPTEPVLNTHVQALDVATPASTTQSSMDPSQWNSNNWFTVVESMSLSGPARELGMQSEFVSYQHNNHRLSLRLSNMPIRLAADRFKSVLQSLVPGIEIDWQVGERQGGSLQAIKQTAYEERMDQAKNTLAQDANVQRLKSELGFTQVSDPIILN
jgi:DNA polymerase-3 subunit gamma/tau